MAIKKRYRYPAVFTYKNGQEIAVTFPDLDVATSGVDEADALTSARELLLISILGYVSAKEHIPEPTVSYKQLKIDDRFEKIEMFEVCIV